MGETPALRGPQANGGGFSMDSLTEAVHHNLGQSKAMHDGGVPEVEIYGFKFPAIPEGVKTTIIQVPVALTTGSPLATDIAVEQAEILAIFLVAGLLWILPWFCANCLGTSGCRCLQNFISRRLGCYFFVGLIANMVLISVVLTETPHISANDVFFASVRMVVTFCDSLEQVLIRVLVLSGVAVGYAFRKQVVALLGYDQMLIRADLRDILTCFVMNRFRTIEVSIWKVQGLLPASITPLSPLGTRSLFTRVLCGYNEPQHSRPHDNCTNSLVLRERFMLNYDPEDETQKMSVIVKQQEVVGAAVGQLAPAAGAIVGGAVGAVSFLGPAGGAASGAVMGVGCANSLGPEVARVDLSSAIINRLRSMVKNEARLATMTGPLVPWNEENFVKVDLVPQGECWIRITDVVT